MAFDLKIVDAQLVACGLYDYSSAGLPDAENATSGMMAVSGGYMHILDDGSWKQLALDSEHDTHNTNLATAVGISVDDTHLGNFATTHYVSNSETAKQALEGLDAGLNSVSGAFATSVSNLQSAVGIGAGAEDLGSFTGAIIADDSSVKTALQALETEAENFRGDLQTAIGISDEAQHLGTFTGAIIADNGTVKAALQALETEAENFRGDLQTAIGISDEAQHLGTFTGGIIADNGTVKAGMQSLETEVENVRGDLQSVLGVDDEATGISWSGLNYLTAMAHSNVSASLVSLDSNLYSISGAFNTSVTNLQSAVGVGAGAEDLGTFSGAIIADESSVKVALQALETEAENFRGDLQTAIGISDEAQHLGTFSGGTISDNGTVKAGMQELETELENVRGDLQNVLGVSDEAVDLGTFSGGIIADESDVKTALQALETEAENFRGDLQTAIGISDEAQHLGTLQRTSVVTFRQLLASQTKLSTSALSLVELFLIMAPSKPVCKS